MIDGLRSFYQKYKKKFKFLRSFRLRIFLIISLVSVFSGEVIRRGIVEGFEESSVNNRTNEITALMRSMADHLVTYGYMQDTSSDVINAEISLFSNIFDGRIQVINTDFRVIKDTYEISVGKTIIGDEVIRASRNETVTDYNEELHFIEVALPVMGSMDENGVRQVEGVLLASASTVLILQDITILERRALLLEMLVCMIMIGLAMLLSGVLTRPFDHLKKAIGEVVSFEDETQIESDYLETEEIVDAFNRLRQRMKVLDDSRQDFVRNVSHELKTPIASVKVLADSLNGQEDAPVEVYRDFMQDITKEIDRENDIISDLLALVRMDKGESGLNIERTDVNELVESTVKRLGPLARKNEVDLIWDSRREVEADNDKVKMSLAISNLIENGIKYNKHPGWVKVVLDADHQFMMLEVSDSGIGIPEEDIDHIFERFYRVDKSHSREVGGTGLGLAITRKTILLHRGSIRVNSVPGEGCVFSVKVPLVHIGDRTGK